MGIPAAQGVQASGLPPLGDQANIVVQGTLAAVGPTIPFAVRGPANLSIWASIASALTTTAGSLTASVASATGLAIGASIKSANVPAGTTIGNLVGTTVTLAMPPICLQSRIRAPDRVRVPDTMGLLGATVTVPSNAEPATLPANTTVAEILTASIAPAANGTAGTWGEVRLSASFTTTPSNNGQIPLNFARTGNAITVTGADAASTFTGPAITFVGTAYVERSFDGGQTFLTSSTDRNGTPAVYSMGQPISYSFGEPEKNVLYRINVTAYTSGTINYRLSQSAGAATSHDIGPLTNG